MENLASELPGSSSSQYSTPTDSPKTLWFRKPKTGPLPPVAPKSAVVESDAKRLAENDIRKAEVRKKAWDPDQAYHETLFPADNQGKATQVQDARLEELRTTPLFSANVLRATTMATPTGQPHTLPQYGLLARVEDIHGHEATSIDSHSSFEETTEDKRLFLNTNAPWSAFVCGSQGSGKSHTLSCMLEAALLQSRGPNKLGKLPNPLAGIVFHYDKFTGLSNSQVCEAAFLCSTGIPVKVLVSPASYGKMKHVYSNMPGVAAKHQPLVIPMLFEQQHLNASRMMKLMAVEGIEGSRPLYMEVVCRILRQIAMASQGQGGFDFDYFQHRLSLEFFNPAQRAMLETRLDLLRDFMQPHQGSKGPAQTPKKPKFGQDKKGKENERKWLNEQHSRCQAAMVKKDTWSFKPGSLTIVDLSCPFIDEGAACDLFDICMSVFLETRDDVGRVVVLDEAHKFMTDTGSSSTFTESLLSVIRLQRHLATRVIIATQEPTISPKLLDLSSMTIVHRFTSPSWLQALRSHLAGVSPFQEKDDDGQGRDIKEIFTKIVNLEAGEALLFSPSMMLGVTGGATKLQTKKLGMGYVKIRVRKRLTADGGRSVMAA